MNQEWLVTQNRVLEQFSTGERLSTVLQQLAEGAERQFEGARCVVMLADRDGESLRLAAAPRMPQAFRDAAAHLPIGPAEGACGTAAYRREPVISRDVQTDPLWASYRDFAATFGIRACWSTPVLSGDGRVLGTFAMAYEQPHQPTEQEQAIIDTCTHLARLVIERRRHERALRESEQRFRAMADSAPVLMWMSGLDKQCNYFNKPWLDFTGRTLEQERGTGWLEGVHPEDEAHCQETYQRAFDRREPFKMDYRLRRADGVYRWMMESAVPRRSPEGEFLGYIGSCIDVTDRRVVEQELRESEHRLRFTLEATQVGTWDWDIKAGTVSWSDNLARLYGRSTAQFNDFLQHVDLSDRDRVVDEIRQAIVHRTPYDTEYRTDASSPKGRWMAARGQVVYDDTGEAVRMTGVCMDITDRREAEEQVRIRVRQQETVAQLGHRALVEEDLQTLMNETVRRVAETLEVPLTKVLECEPGGASVHLRAGVGWRDGLVGKASVGTGLDSQAGYTLQSDAPVVVTHLPSETRFTGPPLLRDHGVISGMSVVIPGRAGRPWGVFGVHTTSRRDFTRDDINFLQSVAHLLAAAIQRKASERELQALNETLEQRVADRTAVAEHRAKQLRALAGELAQTERRERRRLAKLLHDHLQQLLVAAKLRVGAVQARLADPELTEATRSADQLLEQAIEASRSLTVELSPPILYDAGLPAAIEWLARWMKDKHGLEVDLTLTVAENADALPSEACVFLFDAVRELLFNIVKHAGVQQAHVELIHQSSQPLRIIVTDRGKGFDFASLADSDVATAGFGLFNIQQRVQLFGGRMDVRSQPDRGTQITLAIDLTTSPANDATALAGAPMLAPGEAVKLPLGTQQGSSPDEAATAAGADDRASSESTGAGPPVRVLLADDHAPLRQGLMMLLGGQGDIEVVGEAVDGEMAIEAARELRPDVVLMDVHMPGLNGVEATAQLTRQVPGVRVVGLSIEEHEEMARAMIDAGAASYLPKGSPPEILFAAIREHTAVAEGHQG